MGQLALDGKKLRLAQVREALERNFKLRVTPGAEKRVRRAFKTVQDTLKAGKPVYGVNTGFGKLSDVQVSFEKLEELQRNLVLSHAAGVGAPLSERETRLMMLYRINTLAAGHSGCSIELIQRLVTLYNRGILPIIPEQGSVGASGDLAPLAHMSLAVLGEGDVIYKGKQTPAARALKAEKLKPYTLQPKEGLSLINGTQMICAVLSAAVFELEDLLPLADAAAATSMEAMRWSSTPFDADIHRVRPQAGQVHVAKNVRSLLKKSEILPSHANCGKIQDPYCIRCVPQVHGAVRDAYTHARNVLEIEINSVVDNPLVFPDRGVILSGGNFHGQPVAQAADQLAIAVATLTNISERRIEKLTNADASGLPAFLAPESGLHSGFMIAQVTAAALAAENRVLANPASVHSIPTSAEKEDHVSMGPIAARSARDSIRNLESVLAIEWLCAAQGLEFLKPLKPGQGVLSATRRLRRDVKMMKVDRYLAPDIEATRNLLRNGTLLKAIRRVAPKFA